VSSATTLSQLHDLHEQQKERNYKKARMQNKSKSCSHLETFLQLANHYKQLE